MAVGRHEHILGLEIAMDDALVVRRREPAGDLDGVIDRLAERETDGYGFVGSGFSGTGRVGFI